MTELEKAEQELFALGQKVMQLRRDTKPLPVKNYTFKNLEGKVSLRELFGDKDTLFVLHNMGQGCRYCTLWADGFNGFVGHLESRFAFVLASKDDPETQRRFANSRGWNFRMVSHAGSDYLREQSAKLGEGNMPGMACYVRRGDEIFRKNAVAFGPGDEFCSIWNVLSLGGISTEEFTPQFNYWKRPEKLDDGGQNVL